MKIDLCDVGPRDGLQNDSTHVTPEVRAELSRRLAHAGLAGVEAVSFVNDKRVPQMAGPERVIELLPTDTQTTFSALVLNERGYERAIATPIAEIHYAFPVTETFASKNQNTTVAEALSLGKRLIERAKTDGRRIAVGLSASFGCPFEGRVDSGRVIEIARELAAAGADEVAFADTIGVAVPKQVRTLVSALVGATPKIGCHFHDTRNTAVANALAAVESGATSLDSSVGGVGGCPFAPGATGNVATEDLVYMLHGMGYETGVDIDALIATARWLRDQLGHPIPSALARAGNFALSA